MRSGIQAGELRHLIKIVDLTYRQDAAGGVSADDGTPFATVWAKVESLIGRELYAAQQKVSEVTHKITIRWIDGVTAQQVVWFDDRQFDIEATDDPDGRRIKLFLLCVERDNSARQSGGNAE